MMPKTTICKFIVLATGLLVTNIFLTSPIVAQEKTPGFNTKIPEWVLTPDTVETKLGTLKFFDGIPDEKAAAAPNADGSTTIYFSPIRPEGIAEGNWIQTDSKKGWFPMLRLYNPLQSFFDSLLTRMSGYV